MDLELTQDQQELRSVAAGFLADSGSLGPARRLLEGDDDLGELWAALAELGWYAVGLEQDDPFGVTGLCLLAERCGAHATPTALIDTAVAARLAAAGSPALAAIAAAEAPVALCALEPGCGWDRQGLAASLRREGTEWRLDGVKLGVHHAAHVASLAVLAELDGEPAVAFVRRGADGVTILPERGLDPGARAASVELDGVVLADAAVLAGPELAASLDRALAIGAVASAAEAVGAAERGLEMAVAYALERHQFGRQIGSFQALRHLLADLHVKHASATATVLYAAASIDAGLPDALEAAAIAKAHACRAARQVIEGALQALGGIAFTWEHDVHLLQRRVLDCERRYGEPLLHERALGERLAEQRGEVLL